MSWWNGNSIARCWFACITSHATFSNKFSTHIFELHLQALLHRLVAFSFHVVELLVSLLQFLSHFVNKTVASCFPVKRANIKRGFLYRFKGGARFDVNSRNRSLEKFDFTPNLFNLNVDTMRHCLLAAVDSFP